MNLAWPSALLLLTAWAAQADEAVGDASESDEFMDASFQ